jgi:DNA-binding NarL/FixJ family response regulator
MPNLRILIADDHELIRRGLRNLLASRPDWEVVGEACDGVEAVEMAKSVTPDVMIMDYFMPKQSGPEAAFLILEKLPKTKILVLTMDHSEQVIREVLQAGADGLVLKSDADRDLLAAIDSVAQDRPYFAGKIAKTILGRYLTGHAESITKGQHTETKLTERERHVMRLLAEGMTSKQAAIKLRISVRTVESHRINMSRKLNFNSVADMVRYAIRNGITCLH